MEALSKNDPGAYRDLVSSIRQAASRWRPITEADLRGGRPEAYAGRPLLEMTAEELQGALRELGR